MYYEFYLDLYFLENLMMNALVLHMAGQIQKEKTSLIRLSAAAAAAAACSCAIVVLPIHKNVVCSLAVSILLCPFMVVTGYGKRNMIPMTISVMGLSVLLGGIWELLRRCFPAPFYLVVPAGYLPVRLVWELHRRRRRRAQYIYDVILQRGQKKTAVKGLLDSGNRLVQPVTAKPVHIVDFDEIKKLLSEQEIRELTGLLNLEIPSGASGQFLYIPYHSIGDVRGVLPAITLDQISIKHGESAHSTKGALAAISKEAVSSAGEYQMILHPRILE